MESVGLHVSRPSEQARVSAKTALKYLYTFRVLIKNVYDGTLVWNSTGYIYAVSYTHLDVYKRQDQAGDHVWSGNNVLSKFGTSS